MKISHQRSTILLEKWSAVQGIVIFTKGYPDFCHTEGLHAYTLGKQSVIQGYLFSQGIPIAIPRKMGTLGLYSPGSIYRDQGSHFPRHMEIRSPHLEGPHLFSHTDIGVKGNQTPQPFLYPPPQLTVYKHLRKCIAKLASFLAS